MMTESDLKWRLNSPQVTPEAFFKLVPQHFAFATHLFVEGCAIVPEVQEYYVRLNEPGEFLPGANTIWPESSKYRLPYSIKLMDDLACYARKHAYPELLYHLSLYQGGVPLLYWHDAFDNKLWLGNPLSESQARAFASALGTTYEKHSPA